MSSRGRQPKPQASAAIPPPSSIDDEHLPKVNAGKSTVDDAKDLTADSVLSEQHKKIQALRDRLQHCREFNKKEVISETTSKTEKKRADADKDAEVIVGVKRKRKLDSKDPELNRQTTIENAEWVTKRAAKKQKASGVKWSPYNEDASYLSFNKRTKSLPISEEEYEQQKAKLGEQFYPEAHSLELGQNVELPRSNIRRMVEELNTSQKSRQEFSRRRAINDDKDVDYINERNRKFNEKLSRAYDKYTVETRQNLERGTAI